MTGGGVGGTNRDLTGGATGLPVVVGTILYVAYNALDVSATLLVVHFSTVLLEHLALRGISMKFTVKPIDRISSLPVIAYSYTPIPMKGVFPWP